METKSLEPHTLQNMGILKAIKLNLPDL